MAHWPICRVSPIASGCLQSALTLILCAGLTNPQPCGGRKLDERRLRLRLTCKWALARGDARGPRPETGDRRPARHLQCTRIAFFMLPFRLIRRLSRPQLRFDMAKTPRQAVQYSNLTYNCRNGASSSLSLSLTRFPSRSERGVALPSSAWPLLRFSNFLDDLVIWLSSLQA